jgi:zinc transport system substrate-binding protein
MSRAGILLAIVGLQLAGAAGTTRAATTVVAGVEPIRSLVQDIAGPDYEVRTLLPAGASPETYEPQARHLAELSEAVGVFVVGLPFEQVLIRRLSRGSLLQEIVRLAPQTAAAGDPHVWLDPEALLDMAETCARWFIARDPTDAEAIRARTDRYRQKVEAFDAQAQAALSGLATRSFATMHPAYGAFARHYGLQQIAIEVEGRSPSGRSLVAALNAIREAGVRVLLIQPQHSSRQTVSIALELGLRRVEIDPLAPDPLACMMELVQTLTEDSDSSESR